MIICNESGAPHLRIGQKRQVIVEVSTRPPHRARLRVSYVESLRGPTPRDWHPQSVSKTPGVRTFVSESANPLWTASRYEYDPAYPHCRRPVSDEAFRLILDWASDFILSERKDPTLARLHADRDAMATRHALMRTGLSSHNQEHAHD